MMRPTHTSGQSNSQNKAGGPHLPNILKTLLTDGCPTSRAVRDVGFHGREQLLGGAALSALRFNVR